MAQAKGFRVVSDKATSQNVVLMRISPKMDLIALGFETGDVSLHRLAWHRVWMHTSHKNGEPNRESPPPKPGAIAWRPDGRSLAIGWNDGNVTQHDIETGHRRKEKTTKFDSPIVYMNWQRHRVSNETRSLYRTDEPTSLLDLPPLEAEDDSKTNEDDDDDDDDRSVDDDPSVLVVLEEAGKFSFSFMGEFVFCSLFASNPLCGAVSADGRHLTIVGVEDSRLSVGRYRSDLIGSRGAELAHLTVQYKNIGRLLAYMESSIGAMHDAWDNILVQLDGKLGKFADSLSPPKTFQGEFLSLLTRGVMSLELQSFLLNDLTERSLKKFGTSIQTSYTSILKLALGNLTVAGQQMIAQLSHLLGMARWYEQFGVLGLADNLVNACLHRAGSLMLKIEELNHVIKTSVRNLDSFFKLLYKAFLQLQDVPTQRVVEVLNFSDMDVLHVADFLTEELKSEGSLKLERVGQYLQNSDLVKRIDIPSAASRGMAVGWTDFMKGKGKDVFFQDLPGKSLVQCLSALRGGIDIMFKEVGRVVNGSVHSIGVHDICDVRGIEPCVSVLVTDSTEELAVIEPGGERVLLIRRKDSGEGSGLRFARLDVGDRKVSRVSFYGSKGLGLIFDGKEERRRQDFGLLSLDGIETTGRVESGCTESGAIDVSANVGQLHQLPRFESATRLCLGVERGVAAVFSRKDRRVVVLDLEVELSSSDEDEDDEDKDDDER